MAMAGSILSRAFRRLSGMSCTQYLRADSSYLSRRVFPAVLPKHDMQAFFFELKHLSFSTMAENQACTEDQGDHPDKLKTAICSERFHDRSYIVGNNADDEILGDDTMADENNNKIIGHGDNADQAVGNITINCAGNVSDMAKTKDLANDYSLAQDPSTFLVMDIAHKLGITDYDNIYVLGAMAECSEDNLFDNLSFLMSIGFTEKELVDILSAQPHLMSMDLTKSLSGIVKRLQLIEMEVSFLKYALMSDPELVSLFAEKTFQARTKALRDLDFSKGEIATFLRMLKCRQLGQFLRLPMEMIEPAFTFIIDGIGFRNSDAIKVICSCPTVLLRDVRQEFAEKMKVLKSVFDDDKKAKKAFVRVPELLGRKTDFLAETVLFLREMVEDVKKLEEIVESAPIVLTHRKSGIERVSKYLENIGFDSTRAVTLIAREPYLVECGTERLQKHVDFLKSKSLDERAICSLLEHSTTIFFRSLEKGVVPKIEFLEEQGITGETLQKYINSRPQVYRRSLKKTMVPNVDFLLSLGFEKDTTSLTNAIKATLPHSQKSMQERIDYLVSLGIEVADVHKMVRKIPSILVTADGALKKRVDFLLRVMKHPVQELVQCPSFLTSNLEKNIIPRLKVFEYLKAKGLLKKYTLHTLVEIDDAAFAEKYVRTNPKLQSLFKGTPNLSRQAGD